MDSTRRCIRAGRERRCFRGCAAEAQSAELAYLEKTEQQSKVSESMMYEEQTNFDEFDGSSEAENAELSFFESTNEE